MEAADALGGGLSIPQSMRESPRTRAFERILLIKPSSLGDVIHALPVLDGLRRRYPRAHIAWLVGRPFAPLIAGHPALDEIIEFDRSRFGRVWRSVSVTADFRRFTRGLRERRFDLAIDLQGLFRSGYLAWATRAPVRIGFAEARELAWLFYTHRIPRSQRDVHAVDRNCLVGDMLGFELGTRAIDLVVTEAERAEARVLLAEAGLAPGEPFVAITPGARWETKRWFPERFADVIDQLAVNPGLRSVLLGGRDELAPSARIQELCRFSPVSLTGVTTLRQLVAVLAEAAVVLCHDSGPMHMASALGRPMVSLVGPTNPCRTGPYERMDTVMRVKLPCAPCYFRQLAQCKHGHACMTQITADGVVTRVREALEPVSAKADK
jgi:lipopolysaccharide heptosyltransferase I